MMLRIVKIIGLVVGGSIALLFAGVVYSLVMDRIAYKKASITDDLIRDGMYDPAVHFSFDRACTYGPEDGPGSQDGDYRELSEVMLPDTFTHWTLVLFDDHQKTQRTLYIVDAEVEHSGDICLPRFILRTKLLDERLVAYIEIKEP